MFWDFNQKFFLILSWICNKKNPLVKQCVVKKFGKKMDGSGMISKSFRIFSFIVSGTFRSLLWSYEFGVRVSAAFARFCGKDEIAIGCGEDTTLIHERLHPEIDEGRGEGVRYGPPRRGNDSILVKGKSGSARSVYIIRAVLSFLATTSWQ